MISSEIKSHAVGIKLVLPVLLLAWFAANFIPHIVVYLLTGKIYYRLSPVGGLLAETSIMLLNLCLPFIAYRYLFPEGGSIWKGMGWKWTGWSSIGFGLGGFIALLAIMVVTQIVFGPPIGGGGMKLNVFEFVWTLLLMLVLTALSEEMMFRGFLQTVLT